MNVTGVRTSIGFSLIALFLFAGSVGASPNSHDGGFFLRLSGGFAVASSEFEHGSDLIELDGAGGDMNVAIGGVIAPGLAIHGTLFGWFLTEPEIAMEGETGTLDSDLSLAAIGGGFTYYVEPANVYFSVSAGAGELSIETDNVTITSDTGFAMDAAVGKEWWTGDNWGLGVAGHFGYHSIPDGDFDDNWTGASFGVRFTATRN
ncbi:MAG: hypothetical protein HKN20_13325 [Gemmatimonadetes bacterium]|nr:hypothetical protein [Gemmatimonadota bacterium]